VNDVPNMRVKTIGLEDDRPVTHDTVRGIRMYSWAHDNRHILYPQDVGGDESWRIYATDLSTGRTRDLTPFDGVQAHIIRLDTHPPDDEVLIALNKDNPQVHDASRLNIATGALHKAATNPSNVLA